MITKAQIVKIISNKEVVVRIPIYNKMEGVAGATPNSELCHAFICYPSGVIPNYEIEDVVFVSFEDNYLDKPVVLGKLKKSTTKKESNSKPNVNCVDLSADGNTKLSKETTIGEIKYTNIECLKNLSGNIKETFKGISDDISGLKKELGIATADNPVIENGILQRLDSLEEYKTLLSGGIDDCNETISQLDSRVTKLETASITNPIVLAKDTSYGTELPKNPKPGQLFFKLT